MPELRGKPPPPESPLWKLWNALTRAHALAYRVSGGTIGARNAGMPILLLDHIGRRSEKRRTSPLQYMPDGDDLVIVASKGGSPKHPAWWLNLREAPSTTVQVRRERRAVVARQASPEEKTRLWPALVNLYAPYADYQARTSRDIPVVILTRAH